MEERLQGRDEELEKRLLELSRREQGLADREEASKVLHGELKEAKQREVRELERLSGMTVAGAKQHLLERSEDLIRHELAGQVRQMGGAARAEAERAARDLVGDAAGRGDAHA